MAYTIDTIGAIGAVARFVPVVYLGDGSSVHTRTPWARAYESLDDARRKIIEIARLSNLAEPMYSGWVELDGPSQVPPELRARAPQGATAWRFW